MMEKAPWTATRLIQADLSTQGTESFICTIRPWFNERGLYERPRGSTAEGETQQSPVRVCSSTPVYGKIFLWTDETKLDLQRKQQNWNQIWRMFCNVFKWFCRPWALDVFTLCVTEAFEHEAAGAKTILLMASMAKAVFAPN